MDKIETLSLKLDNENRTIQEDLIRIAWNSHVFEQYHYENLIEKALEQGHIELDKNQKRIRLRDRSIDYINQYCHSIEKSKVLNIKTKLLHLTKILISN